MEFNWSAFDGLLGVLLLIVVIWAAFKLVTRVAIGLILAVVLAVLFFGLHLGDFGFG
jgi:hypothetical protein